MLVPSEETAQAMNLPRLSDLSISCSVEDELDVDDVELDPMQERVLRDMAECTSRFWRVDRLAREGPLPPVLAAVTRLELAGLVDREWHGGLNLSRKGRRVARRLDSEG
jgi:hypothetical protein